MELLELTSNVAFATAVVVLGTIAAYCAKRLLGFIRQFVILSRLPYPRKEPFFLGSALELIKPKRMHLALREWAEQLGGIYCFRVTVFHVRNF
jgi:hypothetical protein